jgi:hypothetical protein
MTRHTEGQKLYELTGSDSVAIVGLGGLTKKEFFFVASILWNNSGLKNLRRLSHAVLSVCIYSWSVEYNGF